MAHTVEDAALLLGTMAGAALARLLLVSTGYQLLSKKAVLGGVGVVGC
jgi:hypothetical protein